MELWVRNLSLHHPSWHWEMCDEELAYTPISISSRTQKCFEFFFVYFLPFEAVLSCLHTQILYVLKKEIFLLKIVKLRRTLPELPIFWSDHNQYIGRWYNTSAKGGEKKVCPFVDYVFSKTNSKIGDARYACWDIQEIYESVIWELTSKCSCVFSHLQLEA